MRLIRPPPPQPLPAKPPGELSVDEKEVDEDEERVGCEALIDRVRVAAESGTIFRISCSSRSVGSSFGSSRPRGFARVRVESRFPESQGELWLSALALGQSLFFSSLLYSCSHRVNIELVSDWLSI